MTKRSMLRILMLCLPALLFAADVDSLLERAKEASSKVKGYEITRQNALLNNQLDDIDGTSVTVSVNDSWLPTVSGDASYFPSLSVRVTLPEYTDDLEISTSVTSSGIRLDQKGDYSLSASGQVSKKWEYKSWDDTDISKIINVVQPDLNYRTNMILFENSLIQDAMAIMEKKHQIADSRHTLELNREDYTTGLRSGSIVAGSVNDIRTQMNLSSQEISISLYEENLKTLLSAFFNDYGVEFEDITEVRSAVLDFSISESGNTSVYLAKLNLDLAQQELNEKTGKSSALYVTGSVTPSMNFKAGSGYDTTNVSASAGITYSTENLSVSGTLTDSVERGSIKVPSLIISGTWTNSTKKDKQDTIEIQKLQNAVYEKQRSYDDALYTYNTNARAILNDIDSYLTDVEQFEVSADYHRRILDYTRRLYENGFATQREYDNALYDVEQDDFSSLKLKMQALLLENRIKAISL